MKITLFSRAIAATLLMTSSYCWSFMDPPLSEQEGTKRLQTIHSHLSLLTGSFRDEYPEQLMAAMYITEEDRVLEIGGNVGRNSCVIGSILNDSQHLVVVESDPKSAALLVRNRDHNGLSFYVEDSAISAVPLFQTGWVTVPSNTIPPDAFQVKTITYSQLKEKYKVPFNVLVADCEGALYFILRDDDSILDDVDLIIVENDYRYWHRYDRVRARFEAHGFHRVYNKTGGMGGPCYGVFYQVWKKD